MRRPIDDELNPPEITVKIRVLIWGNTFPRVGGVERFVDNLAHGLIERGHAVAVLSDGKIIDTLTDRPFDVETVPMAEPILTANAVQLMSSVRKVRQVIEAFKPDVIHYNSSALEMPIFVMSALRSGVPIVTTLHFDLNNLILVQGGGTFDKIIKASRRVTSVSRYVHSLVSGVQSLRYLDVEFIENAMPANRPYQPPNDAKLILCLGRLVHEKGFDQMISAMPKILEMHPEARLFIGGLGPEKAALQSQLKAANLFHYVTLLGWIDPDDVHAEMQNANIVAFPSRWEEPFGLVALEAAIAGRPCVGYNVGGITDSIDPGVTGELAKPGDISDLALKISVLLSNPKCAEKQGINAYKKYGNGVRFEKMLDQYETLFRTIKTEIT